MAILNSHQKRFLKEKLLSPLFGKIMSFIYIMLTVYVAYCIVSNLTPQLSDKQLDLQYNVDQHFREKVDIPLKLKSFIKKNLFYEDDEGVNPISPPHGVIVSFYDFKADESCTCTNKRDFNDVEIKQKWTSIDASKSDEVETEEVDSYK